MEENWKDIIGYEGLYQVSDLGRIKMLGNGESLNPDFKKVKIMSLCTKKRRYYEISLSKKGLRKSYKVHRLVAIHFVPNPLNLPEVNHIFGNKWDNRACVLEWNTCKENQIHAYRIGLHINHRGENASNVKLTQKIADEIREKNKTGKYFQRDLAKQYNVHQKTIFEIIHNKRWNYK